MAEIFPRDIRFRIGARTLLRHGVPFRRLALPARGGELMGEIFARADATTCASYVDALGFVRLAAADRLRIDWWDLDGDGIYETATLLLEPGRANAWLWSDDQTNGVWTNNGLSGVGGGDLAPDGSLTACHTVENNVNTSHLLFQSCAGATDNALQSNMWHLKAKERTWAVVRTSGKDGVAKFSYVNLATGATGTIDAAHTVRVRRVANTFWRITVTWNVNAGANAPSAGIGGATGDGVPIFLGDGASGIYVWRGQWEKDASYPTSPIKTTNAAVTRAADALTAPLGFGPGDLTVLARFVRPAWADVPGDLGQAPGLFQIAAAAVPDIRGGGVQATRNYYGYIDTAVADSNASLAIPAGLSQAVSWQFKNLVTAGQVALDVGAGLGAFASAATGFAAFGNQTIAIGGSSPWGGGLIDLLGVSGLRPRAEMLAVP